ncbi:MAG: glycosyltransferase family 39 protein [Anaerolineales bacterium]|nr:glycosyltransferase family 39 protein [Anaerolineales bacterium]
MQWLTRNQVWLLLVLTLLVTAVLRLPHLTTTPPGLHYDEAANAILASEIGWQGERPIFIPSYTGKEVLFFYLAGGLMRLIGSTVLALRLTAAFVGLLTVAATYWLGRELRLGRVVALLAVMLLAVSFWHLVFSRLGFRAITQPLLQALVAATLLRGLRRQQWRWLLASGVLLGLGGYTYLAVRLFPVLLGLAAIPLLRSQRRWGQLAAWAGVGLLVLLPLLLYFWQHPETFLVRITQVAPGQAASWQAIVASYGKSLGMFFWRGDPYVRFNVAERPLFPPLLAPFLLIGWLMCWRNWPRRDWEQNGRLLLILAPFLMILPTALALGEIVPSNLRAIGLIPFVFYLPAIGLESVVRGAWRVGSRAWGVGCDLRHTPHPTPYSLLLLTPLLLTGLATTWRTYFGQWAADPALFYENDGDLTAVSTYLNQTDTSGKQIYVAALHYQHPTLAFLSRDYERVKWLVGSQVLPLPTDQPALIIYPHNSPAPDWAKPLLPPPLLQTADFSVYELPAAAEPTPANPINVNFGNAVTLLGVEVGSGTAGETVPLTLYWRIDGVPGDEIRPFFHLEDQWGHRWSQMEPSAYPTAQWAAGERLVQQVDVPLPPGTPPGSYQVRLGWFAPNSGARLSRLDAAGRYAGDGFVVPGATVVAGVPPDPLPQPPQSLNLMVRPGLELVGVERGKTAVTTGERVELALWWLAMAPLPTLTTRLELIRPDNTGRILFDTQPVHGSYPFANWQTPQFVIDRLSERVPDSFETGQYQLHLRLLDSNNNTVAEADLGLLQIEQANRLFDLPRAEFPLAATFGNEIALRGYNLNPNDDGSYELTLLWQAVAQPAADYTVFVHLLHPDGSCCLWQQDVAPQQGQYPTTRWVPEEVVVDSYRLELPPDVGAGSYPIEIGLYLVASGQRLQVVVPGQRDGDVVDLRPLAVGDSGE